MRAKVDTCFWRHLDCAITGLDDFGGRSYDPALGQFVSADTYDAGGLNRYAYVDDNPTSRTDANGHCWLVCAVIAGVVTAVAVTVVSIGIQAIQNGGDFSKVDYGQAAMMGAGAGLMIGAAIALGPLAGAALDALGAGGGLAGAASAVGEAVTGGVEMDAGIAAAGTIEAKLMSGAAIGGAYGAIEGTSLGWARGDRGGALAMDGVVGAGIGSVGGAIGGLFGGPIGAGMAGSGLTNAIGQLHEYGHVGLLSLGVSVAAGGFGAAVGGANLILGGAVTTLIDSATQFFHNPFDLVPHGRRHQLA